MVLTRAAKRALEEDDNEEKTSKKLKLDDSDNLNDTLSDSEYYEDEKSTSTGGIVSMYNCHSPDL